MIVFGLLVFARAGRGVSATARVPRPSASSLTSLWHLPHALRSGFGFKTRARQPLLWIRWCGCSAKWGQGGGPSRPGGHERSRVPTAPDLEAMRARQSRRVV